MESPCSWPEKSTSDRAKAVEELIKGRHSALQLRCLLNKLSPTSSADNNNNNNNQDLVLNILTSFTNTLSILTNGGGDHHQYYQSDEVSQIQTNATHFSWEARKSEDSGDSCKSTSIVKDRRGCYKRRKCSNSWIRESPNLIDDGYAWRKYGQKVILKAKYPRNYFRCTHKHDQGCLATKQVQRIQDDPPLFRTTYSGHHTCKNLLKASQLFMDSKDHNSPMISFCDKETTINNNNNHPFLSSFPSIKHEHKDDQEIIMPSHDDHHRHDPMTSHNYQSESSDHYLLSPDDHQMTAYDSGVVNSSSLSCTDMGVMVVDSVVNVNFHDDDLLHQFDF